MAAESEAIAQFRDSDEAKCVKNADAIFTALAEAVVRVRKGKTPKPLSNFIAREIATLLSSKTWVEYEGWYFENPDKVNYDTDDINKVAKRCWLDVTTDEYGIWEQVVQTLATFLREAAAFAKRIGSLDAARRYMIAKRYVGRLEDGPPTFDYLSRNDAEIVVRHIVEADDFLWADFELARLEA